jgi:hypothetical protein
MAGGLWPHHALGRSVTDRNSVVYRDLSGITRPAPAASAAATGPTG